jgi:Protein of unknown function (DUF2393)
MGGLIEPSPVREERDSNRIPILIGFIAVAVVVGLVLLFWRSKPQGPPVADPYASYLKLSDIKMSAAENFVGSTVTYIEGQVSNTGNQTVTGATVHVVFKNSLGEIVQAEDVPLQVTQHTGPYLDSVNLSVSPLAPEKTKQFRLTFEHISTDWDHTYPELRVMHVSVK